MKVSWTPEALKTYYNILDYLQTNWSNKEIQKFVIKTNKVINQISMNPGMFRHSIKKKYSYWFYY